MAEDDTRPKGDEVGALGAGWAGIVEAGFATAEMGWGALGWTGAPPKVNPLAGVDVFWPSAIELKMLGLDAAGAAGAAMDAWMLPPVYTNRNVALIYYRLNNIDPLHLFNSNSKVLLGHNHTRSVPN